MSTVSVPVKPGDGLVFDGDETAGRPEQGGRIYEVISPFRSKADRIAINPPPGSPAGSSFALDVTRSTFENSISDNRSGRPTTPSLRATARDRLKGRRLARSTLDLQVDRRGGRAVPRNRNHAAGRSAQVRSIEVLGLAESRPADHELFQDQLGRLGGTIYQLGRIEARIEGRPMVPMSLLNRLRRELIVRLDEATDRPARTIAPRPVLPASAGANCRRTPARAAMLGSQAGGDRACRLMSANRSD